MASIRQEVRLLEVQTNRLALGEHLRIISRQETSTDKDLMQITELKKRKNILFIAA